MIAWLLSPRGLGCLAAIASILCGGAALVGLPLAAGFWSGGHGLGETGRRFMDGLWGLLLGLSLYTGVVAVLLLDFRGIATRFDRRQYTWRRTAVALAVLVGFSIFRWTLSFLSGFLTIRASAGPFYNHADWLGIPVMVSNESYRTTDFFTSVFLMLAACTAGGAYLRICLGEATARLPREVFALFTVGFSVLALDEYLTIHEFLGANLPVIREVTFVGHPDDLVMLGYFVIGMALLGRYLPQLLEDRIGLSIGAMAIALQGLAAFGDAWFPPELWNVEEMLEVVSAGCYYLFSARYAEPWAGTSLGSARVTAA